MKTNYFIFAFIIFTLGQVTYWSLRRFLLSLLFFFPILILFFHGIDYNIAGMLDDYLYPSKSRLGLINFAKIWSFIKNDWSQLILIAAMIFTLTYIDYFLSNRYASNRQKLLSIVFMASPYIVSILFSILLNITSTAPSIVVENPIPFALVIAALIQIYFLIQPNINQSCSKKGITYFTLVFGSIIYFCYYSPFITNFRSIIYAYQATHGYIPNFYTTEIGFPPLKALKVKVGGGGDEFEASLPWTKQQQVGIELLQKYGINKANSIFVAHYSNPFSFALNLMPDKYDNLYWGPDNKTRDFNDIFNTVDYVLFWKLIYQLTDEIYINKTWLTDYKNYMDVNANKFSYVDENEAWILYKYNYKNIR